MNVAGDRPRLQQPPAHQVRIEIGPVDELAVGLERIGAVSDAVEDGAGCGSLEERVEVGVDEEVDHADVTPVQVGSRRQAGLRWSYRRRRRRGRRSPIASGWRRRSRRRRSRGSGPGGVGFSRRAGRDLSGRHRAFPASWLQELDDRFRVEAALAPVESLRAVPAGDVALGRPVANRSRAEPPGAARWRSSGRGPRGRRAPPRRGGAGSGQVGQERLGDRVEAGVRRAARGRAVARLERAGEHRQIPPARVPATRTTQPSPSISRLQGA